MSVFKGVDLLNISTVRQYYWLVTKTAFTKGWSIFGGANLLFAFIAWAVAAKYPQWQAKLNDLTWQVPAVLGLAVIAFRWLVAPFEIHRKTVKQADRRHSDIGDRVVDLEREIKTLRAATRQRDDAALKRRVKARLGAFHSEGEKVFLRYVRTEAEEWGTRLHHFIEGAFGIGESSMFLSDAGYTFLGDGGEKSLVQNWLRGRLQRLVSLIERMDHLSIEDGFTLDEWKNEKRTDTQ